MKKSRILDTLCVVLFFVTLVSVEVSAELAELPDDCPSYTYLGDKPDNSDATDWSESAQGVANDGHYWFFTQKEKLYKYERNWSPISIFAEPETLGLDTGNLEQVGIPPVLKDLGINHYGDLDYYRGYLFVPFEGEVVDPDPDCFTCVLKSVAIIAVFSASDLSLVDWVDVTEHQTKTGWVAINPVDGLLYTSGNKLASLDPLIRYTIDFEKLQDDQQGDFISLKDTIPVVENDGTLVEGVFIYMQGGVFSPWEDLYVMVGKASNGQSGTRGGIHLFRKIKDEDGKTIAFRLTQSSLNNSLFGEVTPTTRSDFPYDYLLSQEPEGIDWWNQQAGSEFSGQLHAILLSHVNLNGGAIWFKHYTADYSCVRYDDSDGDGVSDGDEAYVHNTHPLIIDSDNDYVDDREDNCPGVANENQHDVDTDGLGDVCDPDADGDGQSNNDENACGSDSLDPTSLAPDFDQDDSPDCVDNDDDDDGQTDADELACGSNQFDSGSLSPDFDGDNAPDCVDPDDDNDQVLDDADVCPDTFIPEERIPASGVLGPNRYALLDGDTFFDRNGGSTSVTITDTGGCSAEQIADELNLGKGHYRFGLSESALQSWLNQL